MNILAIETTGAYASVAVLNNNGEIFVESSKENLNHLQFLMPMVGKALEKAGIKGEELDAIAASEGPGSFTGIRIGVSSARALAQAWDKPCVGVPTLKTFLYNTGEKKENIYCPIFDARRSQVYGGAYKWEKDSIYEIVPGGAYMLEEFLNLLEENVKGEEVVFFGDGINAYGDKINQWKGEHDCHATFGFAEENERYQTASSVVKLAVEMLEKGQSKHYQELLPNYMRKAEAERKLEEAQKVKEQ